MTVQDILQQCKVEGNVVKLPDIIIDRKLYLEVAKKIELIGGKWKGHKIQGFVFEENPTELLAEVANSDDRNLKKEYQFFPTPKDIANDMALMLQPILKPETIWLEPSAGDGALIKAVADTYGSIYDGGMYGFLVIDCYELMDLNRKKLAKISQANIIGDDFLQCDRKDYYDIIIANPPFTKNQDIDHIRKMFEVLKPGGTIVTLSSPSWYHGTQKKQVEFKAWLESMDVFPQTLPAKIFQESGTNITPLLLMIQKPKVQEYEAVVKVVSAQPESGQMIREDLTAQYSEKTDIQECDAPVIKESEEQVEIVGNDGKSMGTLNKSIVEAFQDHSLPEVKECDATKVEPVEEVPGTKEPSLPPPAVILDQMIENEKDIQSGLQDVKQMLSLNNNDMNFFQQLYDLMDGIDVTMRCKRINGKLQMEVLPQVGATIKPAMITGTPEEFDEGFFQAISVPVLKAKGFKLDFDALQKSMTEAREEAEKRLKEAKKTPDAKKAEEPKKPEPKQKMGHKTKAPVKEKIAEPSLF